MLPQDYDPSDPLRLMQVIGNSWTVPDPPGGNGGYDVGIPTPTRDPSTYPHIGDLITVGDTPASSFIEQLMAPQYTRTSVSKLVGQQSGKQDISGLPDLLANLSFQRLWESYNPGKDATAPSWPNDVLASGITRHQGEGQGHLWGYVDPSWLQGFNPGTIQTTITEVITPIIRRAMQRQAEQAVESLAPPEPELPMGPQPYLPDNPREAQPLPY